MERLHCDVYGAAFTAREMPPLLENFRVADPETLNLMVLHGELQANSVYNAVAPDQIESSGLDYLALGHVHLGQARQFGRTLCAWPGCLMGRGFDECGQKGFVLLDIDEQALTATTKMVSCSTRTLYTLPVDVTGVMTTNEAAKQIELAINTNPIPSNSLVKIMLTGALNVECELSMEYLSELFSDYYYFVKLENATRLQINDGDYEKDESLKGEFVRMVMNSDLDEEKKSEVLRCGIMALSGEEI